MAPNIDREAEHIKEKARKDLLALLENVRASDNADPNIDKYADAVRFAARRTWCSAENCRGSLVSLSAFQR